jgi:hypothetical protein
MRSAFMTLMATSSLVALCLASDTLPNPPSPRTLTVSYSPKLLLASKSSPALSLACTFTNIDVLVGAYILEVAALIFDSLWGEEAYVFAILTAPAVLGSLLDVGQLQLVLVLKLEALVWVSVHYDVDMLY